MIFLLIITILAVIFTIKYSNDKKQGLENQSLILNIKLILEDIENACHKASKDGSIKLLLAQEYIQQLEQYPNATRLRIPLLIKEELEGEELIYICKIFELALKQKINDHYRYYSNRTDLIIQWKFPQNISKRVQLNYIDLEILFFCEQ